MRKLIQIDNLNELPKEKRPPDKIIWDGTSEDLDDWLNKVLKTREKPEITALISEDEIE